MDIVFRKSGSEIKSAIVSRRIALKQRLDRRNAALAEFMMDSRKVRSYLVRNARGDYGHRGGGYVLFGPDDISSEERQELDQLCERIWEMEQELLRLAYVDTHLDDEEVFELSFQDLLGYGFEAGH